MDIRSFIAGRAVGESGGGGGGTNDYEDLSNLPQINNVTLKGNKSSSDLGLASSTDIQYVQYSTMPEASASNAGKIVQFTGATDTYTNGYFYKCVENDGVYSWENINVQQTTTPDGWTSTAQVDSNSTVTFTGLNDSLAYALYVEDKLATITSVTKTGSGTSVSLAYVLSGVSTGDYCKLRIVR